MLSCAQELVWDEELPAPHAEFVPLVEYLRKLGQKFDAQAIKANLKPTNELLDLIEGMKQGAGVRENIRNETTHRYHRCGISTQC